MRSERTYEEKLSAIGRYTGFRDLIDNLNGNTLAQALRAVLDGDTGGDRVAEPVGSPDEVRIATAFFNPTGFAEIADHLQSVPVVRLLLGADPAAGAPDRRRLGQTEAAFERQRMRAGLRRMDEALRQERDRLPFNRTSGAALRLIRDTGGAIVADEVGLGKTFIAGEVLQLYRERRQRALLVCPAALRDTTWRKFLTRFQLFAECLSFEELANDLQLRDVRRPHAAQETLQRPLDEYQLVVVDEAHNYRNPDAPIRAAVVRRLLFGRRRDLLLLTATPVNNSLWELYHLVRFFVRQDARSRATRPTPAC